MRNFITTNLFLNKGELKMSKKPLSVRTDRGFFDIVSTDNIFLASEWTDFF